MSVLVEFAMFPTNMGDSVGEFVNRIISMMDKNNISFELTSMGTIFEVERLEDALDIINMAYQQLEPDCSRIYSTISLDIRKDRTNRIEEKVKSINKNRVKSNI